MGHLNLLIYFFLIIPLYSTYPLSLNSENKNLFLENCSNELKKQEVKGIKLPLITQQLGKNFKQILSVKDIRYHEAKDKLESEVHEFLRAFKYRELKWPSDLEIRDTGDYLESGFNGHKYNGTHPAVVVYYSPEVFCWLRNNRKGSIPDGSVIIKEMYPPPAGKYQGIPLKDLFTPWWTVMIKDSRASVDGWFWLSLFDSVSNIDNVDGAGKRTYHQPLSSKVPELYPEAGFGSYCIRCHSSAESESTFLSMGNVEGPYLIFKDDKSWQGIESPTDSSSGSIAGNHPKIPGISTLSKLKISLSQKLASRRQSNLYLKMFSQNENINEKKLNEFKMLHESMGRAWAHGDSTSQWVTSDQCMGCHAGDNTPYGPNMFLKNNFLGDAGVDLSPWGEWRFSAMGLAGRDPIFHAQLEREKSISKGLKPWSKEKIEDTCLSCHGAMGHKQFHLDNKILAEENNLAPMENRDQGDKSFFTHQHHFELDKYGGLARDGISCLVCHQMKENFGRDLVEIATGKFETIKITDGKNTVIGPYKDDVKTLPMIHSLSMRPEGSDFIKSSRLCASCHTVHLPVLDKNGAQIKNGETIVENGVFEQSTYLEWVNSKYFKLQSCQDCHMPDHYGDERNKTIGKIANVQDYEFPKGEVVHDEKKIRLAAHYLVPDKEITIKERLYRRHSLQGINIFLLEIFRQFPDFLGINPDSYMTYNKKGLEHAILEGDRMAKNKTAKVEIIKNEYDPNNRKLKISVKVTNLTGHKFPSGVGFRRAFLELKVLDSAPPINLKKEMEIWCSGCTNEIGIITDGKGIPLPSEFQKGYQTHHQKIKSDKEVQIYEELSKDDEGNFTTSFLRIFEHQKDNRLLPIGWTLNGPSLPKSEGIKKEYIKHGTSPGPLAIKDPDFIDGTGSDTIHYEIDLENRPKAVETTLYYQSLPPRYLNDLIGGGEVGIHRQRLRYMITHLKTKGTPIQNWKLKIASDRNEVP